MSVFANLDAVLEELEALGVRAEAFLRDEEGRPGVVTVGREWRANRTFTTDRAVLEDAVAAREWAIIVAALVLEVQA